MDINDKLGYTPEELSKVVPISVKSLSRDRSDGHLNIPYTKNGSNIIYAADIVREWLKSTSISPLQYKAQLVSVGKSEVKRSKGRPKGTTKVELAKRRA